MQQIAGNNSRSWLAWMIFILSFTITKGNVFRGDSITGKYSILDPRNPNCPCHLLQQKAEQEFRKINKLEKQSIQDEKINKMKKDGSIETRRQKKYYRLTYRVRRRCRFNQHRKNIHHMDLPCFVWVKTDR